MRCPVRRLRQLWLLWRAVGRSVRLLRLLRCCVGRAMGLLRIGAGVRISLRPALLVRLLPWPGGRRGAPGLEVAAEMERQAGGNAS